MFCDNAFSNYAVSVICLGVLGATVNGYDKVECKRHRKTALDKVYAMPLLPSVYPFKLERKRCTPINPLIVGGTKATAGEFPHMAALGYKKNRTGTIEWLCGGSLITDRHVLTAAHCIDTRWGKPTLVRLGTTTLDGSDSSDSSVLVKEIAVHPEYKPPAVDNDLALLVLQPRVAVHAHVRPACLTASEHMLAADRPVVATGWGRTAFGQASSTALLKVRLKIVDKGRCSNYYSIDRYLPNGIDNKLFCAGGYSDPSHDTCQGDSGGPVQVADADDCTQYVVGITSFGKYCGSGTPAVYIKIAPFIPWIESIAWPLKNSTV